jgi:hypothetical protein
MLDFKNLNKKSLEVYLTDKGYKFDNFYNNKNSVETKSFKLFEILDRIHFLNFTYTINESNAITDITYSYNRGILLQNHLTEIKSLKFKLINENYSNLTFNREYFFENNKTKIYLSDVSNQSDIYPGNSYYYLKITY